MPLYRRPHLLRPTAEWVVRRAPDSVTTMVNGLRAKVFVVRGAGDGDRRSVTLGLTDAGAGAVHRPTRCYLDIASACVLAMAVVLGAVGLRWPERAARPALLAVSVLTVAAAVVAVAGFSVAR